MARPLTSGSQRQRCDVYGLGNALVDLEYRVDDAYLRDMDLAKGHMTLVDESRIDALAASLDKHEPKRRAGGSAANTVFAVHAFGGRCAGGHYWTDSMYPKPGYILIIPKRYRRLDMLIQH